MRSHRSLLIVAGALLIIAGGSAAQEPSSAILKTLRVRQLAARGGPEDNARLSAHYFALGDRYSADARRHTLMSLSFAGNARRHFGGGMSAHCKRLADLNAQEGAALRELSTYHDELAGGVKASPPADAARFHSRAGAAPADEVLAGFAAKAGTPAEFHSLEEYFVTVALVYSAAAKEHAAFAVALRERRLRRAADLHDRMAALSTAATKEAYEAVRMIKSMAADDR